MTLAERLSEYVRAAFSVLYVRSSEHDDAVAELASLCRDQGWSLATWDVDRGLALDGRESGVGPAVPYRLALGNPVGRIAFISAMSAPFCATCNRLRLTANGVLRSCLFEGGEVEIRNLLRTHPDPSTRRTALANAMTECVRLKPDVHTYHGNQQMSRIGG